MTADGRRAKLGLYQNAVRRFRHVARHLNADGYPKVADEARYLANFIETLLKAKGLPRAGN